MYQKGFSGVSSGLKSVTLYLLVNARGSSSSGGSYPVKSAVRVRIIIFAVRFEVIIEVEGWRVEILAGLIWRGGPCSLNIVDKSGQVMVHLILSPNDRPMLNLNSIPTSLLSRLPQLSTPNGLDNSSITFSSDYGSFSMVR